MRGKSSTALQRVGSRGPVFLYDLQDSQCQQPHARCLVPVGTEPFAVHVCAGLRALLRMSAL
jgi:hypothetical protein